MKELLKKLLPTWLKIIIRKVLNRLLILPSYYQGFRFATHFSPTFYKNSNDIEEYYGDLSANALWEYFDQHDKGPGLWKWIHYFPMYHRHFSKFVGKPVRILEIGIYSGGSLEMWQSYFGTGCHVYGVDIESACMTYQSDSVDVHIGDQADRNFWKLFFEQIPAVDIVVDDGGHTPTQQRVTLEEVLPRVSPGGVYLCEDIHDIHNPFSSYATGLVSAFNYQGKGETSTFQAEVHSIHFYPYAMVIEKNSKPVTKLMAPQKGTSWQPFF